MLRSKAQALCTTTHTGGKLSPRLPVQPMLESEAPARSPPYSMVVPCWITLISKDSIGAVTTLGTVEFLAPLGIAKSYLRPRPIPLLNNLRNRPAFRFGFAAEDVLDDHGGREGRGDVEDFEIAVIEKHGQYIGCHLLLGRKDTHNDFPVCLSSQTLLDLLKMCSFVCSAGNM
jgi:hypothetical protein